MIDIYCYYYLNMQHRHYYVFYQSDIVWIWSQFQERQSRG